MYYLFDAVIKPCLNFSFHTYVFNSLLSYNDVHIQCEEKLWLA